MRDGYRRIQVKVGLDPREDVERMEAVLAVLPAGTVVYADANGVDGARRTCSCATPTSTTCSNNRRGP